MGDDHSKKRFADCADKIVADDGGRVLGMWFEQNMKWARVHVHWDTVEQKAQIIYDLQGQEVVDLISADDADEFIAKREGEAY